ncbi:uncharacterized protein V6R79_003167 [Siganus canaliculatus]
MPDVEPLRFPSREGRPNQKDQTDLQAVSSGRCRTSLCVNNAFYHIQELKMTVENWCRQSGTYQPQIVQDKPLNDKAIRFQSKDSDAESVTSTELFVEGIAISARAGPESCPLLRKINDVLGEVVCLIERLEADRLYAEEALHKEERRKKNLENKFNNLMLWKQKEHAFVVQREHESCMADIAELKRQLKLEREKLKQTQEKLSHTEALNLSILEDISCIKMQLPVVKDNVDLQRQMVDQICVAQAEADEVRSKTQSALLLAQMEHKQMELNANNEKASLDLVLSTIKSQLTSIMEDLEQLKMHETGMSAEIKEAERTIALTEEKCATIAQHMSQITEHEKTEKEQILNIKFEIEDKLKRNKKLKSSLVALQDDVEKTRVKGEAEVCSIEEQLHSRRQAFAAIHKENTECKENVENYKIKLSESKRAGTQMRIEMKHMLQNIIDNDKRWENAKEEMTLVVDQHTVTQTKLDEQKQLFFLEEQRARKAMESLRKDLSGQMTNLEQLQHQCASINEELRQKQRSSELTNRKLQKEYEDASSTTKALEEKLKKIKKLADFEKIQCERRNALANLEKGKKLKYDLLKSAQDVHSATLKKCDDTMDKISDLMKESEQCRDATVKMEEEVNNMTEVIAELQSVFGVAEFKNKSAALIMSTLQSDINNCQQRTQRSMQTHAAHVTARRKEMEDTKEALQMALQENEQLATKYQVLQKTVMEAKAEAVSTLSKKNQAHRFFHHYTQLSLLQKRMHKALVKYFKQRSLDSQAELDRCQTLCRETNQKIKTAQDDFSEQILHVSANLRSLTDDSNATNDAGVNKQAS